METDLSSPRIQRGVTTRSLKGACFALEALNGLATTYFFYYLYFYTEKRFQFTAMQNLLLAALLGFVYAFGALHGGRFAQKFGYFTSVRCGAAVMIASFLLCSVTDSLWLTIGLAMTGSIGMCLTWPAMEALVSEGEPPAKLQGLLGFYNFVWAAVAGFAYFTGGALQRGCGWKASMFYIPSSILLVELALAAWLQRKALQEPPDSGRVEIALPRAAGEDCRSPIAPATFLKLAWLANPMAYLAINTIISSVPALAQRLNFSPMLAGFVCSIWLFARAGAFIALWLWPGWHYRFRFLAAAYVVLIFSFAAMLLAPQLWALIAAQIFLGPALGLIYYSSLFYSMDVGDTKGEHGGIHEAVIGIGNCAGPATAAAALKFFPGSSGSGVWAVCLVLAPGLAVLYWLRYRGPKPAV